MMLFKANILPKICHNALRGAATEATINLEPFKLYKLDVTLPSTTKLTKDEAMIMYTRMMTIRKMEVAAKNMYRQKKIRGYCHLYIGEEACAVGIYGAMRNVDTIIASYRCHAWAYLTTKQISCCLSELTGRESGICKGKGGPMHMYYDGFFGGQGIVAAQVPQGAGVALAHKYLGTKGVSVTVYGDGAANQGQVLEAFNMAKLWNLPCLFICENNGYAMGTSLVRGAGNIDFYTRGDYIPGLWVDGMDVLSVREAARFALEYCSSGKGPLVMELYTYRFSGHSTSDPDTSYRTREEVIQKRQTHGPIKMYKDKLISAGLAAERDFIKIDDKIKKEVDAAVKFADVDKELPLTDLASDVLVQNIEKTIRGIDPWSPWKAFNRPKSELKCKRNK